MPLVLYANHASWWDPLVFLVIKRAYFPDRTFFAPIDSRMLERYSFFRKLGFFGVEPGTRRGAAQFLRTSEIVLGSPGGMLALTPQSRFADVRERPVRFASGLGYLAARLQNARFVPVAAEYVFWNERLPEILVRFGAGIETPANSGCGRDAQAWTGVLERGLQEAQEALSLEAQSRDPARFSPLLRGRAGQGGAYDWWRAAKAFLRGRTFNPEHGAHEP
jgi:1-acyl-sn-glycerol-3-phosphate acyltransferase